MLFSCGPICIGDCLLEACTNESSLTWRLKYMGLDRYSEGHQRPSYQPDFARVDKHVSEAVSVEVLVHEKAQT